MWQGTLVMHECQANPAPDAQNSRSLVWRMLKNANSLWESCNLCRNRATVGSLLQRLQEVPQLDGRKLPEALLNVPLVPLQEHPARHAVAVAVHEVHPAPHRGELAVGLDLDVDIPMIVAAIELPHVLGALLAGKRDAPLHGL